MALLLNKTTMKTIRETIRRTKPIYKPAGSESVKPNPLRLPVAPPSSEPSLNIMFFVNKHNSLSQRIAQELVRRNHKISVQEITDSNEMTSLTNKKQPDMILCPFLTKRVPDEVCNDPSIPCLIVHPGIEGDRGMTSIDWALKDGASSWGVTVLQADEVMDAGDIWGTKNFKIDRQNVNTLTKSSLYVNEVTNAAVEGCLQAVDNFVNNVPPKPLDYSMPHVHGKLRPTMKKSDRRIDWENPAEDVARQIRMSDSSPGASARFKLPNVEERWSDDFRVFGAHIEETGLENSKGVPGEVLGHRNNALLVKCGRGAIWVSHLKKDKLKLPATYWLSNLTAPALPNLPHEVPHGEFPRTFQEIWTTVSDDGICHVNFDFYNGAMSTSQCQRLESVLTEVENDDRVKVILLKGGFNFFSNGIHLNVIERSSDPAKESWRNINAINEVVQRVFMSNKVTISTLQGNAGAGGAMMALASDMCLARKGVVLNPHYRSMHLFGSEYHTFFLPCKVGQSKAQQLLDEATPLISEDAVRIGFLDGAYGKTHQEFSEFVDDVARHVSTTSISRAIQNNKQNNRNDDWIKTLQKHRVHELAKMARNFQSSEYHEARKAFVYH